MIQLLYWNMTCFRIANTGRQNAHTMLSDSEGHSASEELNASEPTTSETLTHDPSLRMAELSHPLFSHALIGPSKCNPNTQHTHANSYHL